MGSSFISSVAIIGLTGVSVQIEADHAFGLPRTTIVGLPDAAISEARDRVKSAIKNSGFSYPPHVVTINLAPADVKKYGPGFDLPIAIAILLATGVLEPAHVENIVFLGELGLHGDIRPIRGALLAAQVAARAGGKTLVVPTANADEAAVIADVQVHAAHSLRDLICALQGRTLAICKHTPWNPTFVATGHNNFADIRGQQATKRALEIAAAGGHNALIFGPPGSGKTLLARALPGILPPLSYDESLAVTGIHSLYAAAGTYRGLMTERPFRAPHHGASASALVGGGTIPRPGEVSLAHRGILFLDELPEFSKHVLEALRQPLEDGVVTISRAAGSIEFPAQTTLIAALNPCPCGYFGTDRACTCTDRMRMLYLRKISGPLLDRIDLAIHARALSPLELTQTPTSESSEAIRERVIQAQGFCHERGQKRRNADLQGKEIVEIVKLTREAEQMLQGAMTHLQLSGRGYHRTLRVARTIADLAKSDATTELHVAEALSYRLPKTLLTP
ncbi:YifB family Mg chelatase-like AAA ATPase [Patescibacteria group bacterium]|nr:YifB family Mg chelatase-like AAA ATPase [Patescibacteria group bacterium]